MLYAVMQHVAAFARSELFLSRDRCVLSDDIILVPSRPLSPDTSLTEWPLGVSSLHALLQVRKPVRIRCGRATVIGSLPKVRPAPEAKRISHGDAKSQRS
jgi:hypothetical protein